MKFLIVIGESYAMYIVYVFKGSFVYHFFVPHLFLNLFSL